MNWIPIINYFKILSHDSLQENKENLCHTSQFLGQNSIPRPSNKKQKF